MEKQKKEAFYLAYSFCKVQVIAGKYRFYSQKVKFLHQRRFFKRTAVKEHKTNIWSGFSLVSFLILRYVDFMFFDSRIPYQQELLSIKEGFAQSAKPS
ncbi:MAG: hypothetical protein E7539_06400 [Ruminococcaceae bacterium]|nr:hypothetical protein [Oscillospiraceae bacterium]